MSNVTKLGKLNWVLLARTSTGIYRTEKWEAMSESDGVSRTYSVFAKINQGTGETFTSVMTTRRTPPVHISDPWSMICSVDDGKATAQMLADENLTIKSVPTLVSLDEADDSEVGA